MIGQTKKIGIIILAAGGSSRLGSAKQLLKHRNHQSLVRHIAELAITALQKPVTVVLGAQYETIKQELTGLDLNLVINEHWQQGISSSIKTGLNFLINLEPKTEAVIFLVCDQPFVDPTLIQSIIKKYIASGKPIVACQYQETMGTPALFDARFFDELKQLEGDKGAGKLIHQYPEEVALIAFEPGGFDIDTQEEYKLYMS